jgi:hypothetical protein
MLKILAKVELEPRDIKLEAEVISQNIAPRSVFKKLRKIKLDFCL